jgi:hypothetical protein
MHIGQQKKRRVKTFQGNPGAEARDLRKEFKRRSVN